MKVLHVVWDLGQGGAQTYVHDLIKQHKVYEDLTPEVLVLSHGGPLSEAVSVLGVPVTHLNMKNGYDWRRICKLRNYMHNTKYDLVHSHCYNFAFNFILRKLAVPSVYTEHGGSLLGGKWQTKLAYNLFKRNYFFFIAISKEMARVMLETCPGIRDKIVIVYNGVDIEQIDRVLPPERDGLPEELFQAGFKVGFVGRLVSEKGVDTFLKAAAALCRMRDDVVFPIIGDGSLRQQLEHQAQRLGLMGKAFFLGYRPDAKSILKIFDVFLFTSNYEGFGLSLTEAMAAGVPVVALSLRGAVEEIIQDGEHGFMVHDKNAEKIAECVNKLLSDISLRKQFADKARARVEEHFAMKRNADQVLQIYHKCIAGIH